MDTMIHPVHPAFGDRVVLRQDILTWSVISGIPARFMEAFVRGALDVEDTVASRIALALGEELTQQIINDYDPLRGIEFNKMAQPTSYTVIEEYPTTLLVPGDLLRCDDNRWMKLSSVSEPVNGMILLHSGEVPAARVSVNDHVIAAVFAGDRDSQEMSPSSRQQLDRTMSRELFAGDEISADRADMAEEIMNRLSEIRGK